MVSLDYPDLYWYTSGGQPSHTGATYRDKIGVVYILFLSRNPVYVGSSSQLPRRASVHRSKGMQFDSVGWWEHPILDDRQIREEIERRVQKYLGFLTREEKISKTLMTGGGR